MRLRWLSVRDASRRTLTHHAIQLTDENRATAAMRQVWQAIPILCQHGASRLSIAIAGCLRVSRVSAQVESTFSLGKLKRAPQLRSSTSQPIVPATEGGTPRWTTYTALTVLSHTLPHRATLSGGNGLRLRTPSSAPVGLVRRSRVLMSTAGTDSNWLARVAAARFRCMIATPTGIDGLRECVGGPASAGGVVRTAR